MVELVPDFNLVKEESGARLAVVFFVSHKLGDDCVSSRVPLYTAPKAPSPIMSDSLKISSLNGRSQGWLLEWIGLD